MTPAAPAARPSAARVALPAPVCVKVGLGTKVLGATNIKKGKAGVVKVQLKNTGRVSASNASASFAIPSGFIAHQEARRRDGQEGQGHPALRR